ncbi:uncharacterized protein LOC124210527 [Daphnia pulex]|uniref:uncharacterized protein LOC124210527 n=1 Tax=Daphnia pulex TaxID=6669 RepID=UPI001EE0057E|nr:uncharacterized protein LOC124210527 [Daphnia pulex]
MIQYGAMLLLDVASLMAGSTKLWLTDVSWVWRILNHTMSVLLLNINQHISGLLFHHQFAITGTRVLHYNYCWPSPEYFTKPLEYYITSYVAPAYYTTTYAASAHHPAAPHYYTSKATEYYTTACAAPTFYI